MKVLIVEDDRTLADLVATVARGKGFEVETFESPEGVLERIEIPCTVLVDLTLGDGDGAILVRSIKENPSTSGARVILLSGRRDIESVSTESRADGWLRKPFGLAELEEMLGGTGVRSQGSEDG